MMIRSAFVLILTLSSLGCRETVSPDELRAVQSRAEGAPFPGTLILEHSTPGFQYFRIETERGISSRYRVPVHARESTSPWRHRLGEVCTVHGRALDAKAGALVEGPDVFVFVDLQAWPESARGRNVSITGVVAERFDLPVFIDCLEARGALGKAGIPVPIGTDLRTASRRFLLTDIRWHLAPSPTTDN